MDSSFPTLLLIHKEILITPVSFGHFSLHCSSIIPPYLGKACMPTYCFSCELSWHMRGGTSLLLDGGKSLYYPQDLPDTTGEREENSLLLDEGWSPDIPQSSLTTPPPRERVYYCLMGMKVSALSLIFSATTLAGTGEDIGYLFSARQG